VLRLDKETRRVKDMGCSFFYNIVIASIIVLAFSTPGVPQDNVPKEPVAGGAPGVSPSSTVEDKSERRKQAEEQIQSQIKDLKASQGEQPQEEEPDHIRGVIAEVNGSSIVVKEQNGKGKAVPLEVPEDVTVLALSKDSFTSVDFGVYVGAVGVKLDQYSPIVRDSLSWLHEGYELRFMDNELRGIALGHKNWDLVPKSIIAHGWIDDIEDRVLSIKWGPTELEETDVEIARGKPVFRMSLGDKSLIKKGAHVFVGAKNGTNGKHTTLFIIVGKDGLVPAL